MQQARKTFRAAEKRYRVRGCGNDSSLFVTACQRYGDGRPEPDLSAVVTPPTGVGWHPVVDGVRVHREFLPVAEQAALVRTALTDWSGGTHNNLYRDLGASSFPHAMGPLRWTTLGWHYDWTRRTYVGCDTDPLPRQLVELGARAVPGFVGDAAIVNYYPTAERYVLCGHRDDAERCGAHPVVSLSLGCAAVFLVGAREDVAEPTALWLQSGDCNVLEGPRRYALHGVPRVQLGTCPRALLDALEEPFASFLSHARININIRNASCPGCTGDQ